MVHQNSGWCCWVRGGRFVAVVVLFTLLAAAALVWVTGVTELEETCAAAAAAAAATDTALADPFSGPALACVTACWLAQNDWLAAAATAALELLTGGVGPTLEELARPDHDMVEERPRPDGWTWPLMEGGALPAAEREGRLAVMKFSSCFIWMALSRGETLPCA